MSNTHLSSRWVGVGIMGDLDGVEGMTDDNSGNAGEQTCHVILVTGTVSHFLGSILSLSSSSSSSTSQHRSWSWIFVLDFSILYIVWLVEELVGF